MPSKKASDADNQQERLETIGWIVGFVDGEGCFSVSILKNPRAKLKLGWQVFCEFVVTQGAKSERSLLDIESFFKCGYIVRNKRKDNHHEDLLKYCVRSIDDLQKIIIPFFERHPLRTAKRNDFDIFKIIIRKVLLKEHLSKDGLYEIADLISTMNRKKKPKFLESSETIRQIPSDPKGKI